jgi:ABC-type nitrate/sulfonate/bicarbonate transport system substrate-binding protein
MRKFSSGLAIRRIENAAVQQTKGDFMKRLMPLIGLLVLCSSVATGVNSAAAEEIRLAYISDSPGSSAPYWIAKEAGFYKKYGLDVELIFINGSTRGIQSLIAGDLDFTGAVGTSAINGRLAGGDIFIIDSLVNTLPYYIVGSPKIKSPEDLKGRTLATHIPARPPILRCGLRCANTASTTKISEP